MVGPTLAALVAFSGLSLAIPSPNNIQEHTVAATWKSKIKNVVVLCEENRSFDTFAGGLTYDSAINGLIHHNYW